MGDTTSADFAKCIAETGIPRFSDFQPKAVAIAADYLEKRADEFLARIDSIEVATWENTLGASEDLDFLFQQIWSPFSHLMSVSQSDELRAEYEGQLPRMVQLGLKIEQNQKLYGLLNGWKNSERWEKTPDWQKKAIDDYLLGAKNSGIALDQKEKEEFNSISEQLSKLSQTFSNHILDATNAWKMIVTEKIRLKGLPESFLKGCAEKYAKENDKNADYDNGPWQIGLSGPEYMQVLKYADDRSLRKEFYFARISLAGPSDEKHDNSKNMLEILRLRRQKSNLLGYNDFTELSLSEKMASTSAEVKDLLDGVASKAKPLAQDEYDVMNEFAKKQGYVEDEMLQWDTTYASFKYREQKLGLNHQEVKKYFTLEKTLEGLFAITKEVLGVVVSSAEDLDGSAIPKWHEDVRYYTVKDAESGQKIAAFFLDPFARPGLKRGGAWMNVCQQRFYREADSGLCERAILPTAYLVCNSLKPSKGEPALLDFSDVVTLFHEFGHGLQHMLTKVNYSGFSGISGVEWDAVELPSQFMENWAYQADVLLGMTAHKDTGAPLPSDMIAKLQEERFFLEASATMRQVCFALTDIEMHLAEKNTDPMSVYRKIADRTSVLKPIEEDAFLCQFSHVFSGGYASGYYSYKWAEVMSADAFGFFEEKGASDPAVRRELGQKFRETVLGLGGSKPAAEVYELFRGRGPKPDSLLACIRPLSA